MSPKLHCRSVSCLSVNVTTVGVRVADNVLVLQAVACRVSKLSEFARTMQAQNNNNQSQIKLLIVVAVMFSAFYPQLL